MSQNSLPKSFKVCATCGFWGGIRSAENCVLAKFEMNQTGKCSGGGFNQAQTNPMATCGKWEAWPAIR